MSKKYDVIAVDFDGTLSADKYPNTGNPNMKLINKLIELQKDGTKIILNTMREGSRLQEAVDYCKRYGIEFDAVNDNLPFLKMMFKNNPRKIYADLYVDDCNAGANDDHVFSDLPFKTERRITNADHIRHMDDSELADYIMRAKGAAYKLICDDCYDGCWFFDCKTNHHCNGGNGLCMVTKEDVLRWLKSEVNIND